MSVLNEIQNRRRARELKRSSDDWSKRVYNDPTNPANRYRMSMEEDTVNRMADAENKRKMALQQLQESGATERQKLVNTGNLGVAKLSDIGETTRRGMTEQGFLNRLGAENKYTFQRDRETALRENMNYWTRPQFDNTGMQTKGPVDPSLASKYALSMEDAINSYNNTPEASGGRKYDNITRKDGSVEYYDNEGKLAYIDKPKVTTPNVPGSTIQNISNTQSPLPRKGMIDETINKPMDKQKETFESVYGQRPTLKSIWAEDERRKKERDAKRKSQWTVPY